MSIAGWRPGTRGSRSPRAACRLRSTGWSSASALAPLNCSACRRASGFASVWCSNEPWTAYSWYDGGLQSRIDINTDLPARADDLAHTVAHETYPGHHLEHAWKDADLVEERRRVESSLLLINTPECLIGEGLADLGVAFASPVDACAGAVRRAVRARGRSDRRRSEPTSRGGRARDGAGRAACDAPHCGRECRADATRRWGLPRGGHRLSGPGGPLPACHRREAERVPRPPAVADVCLRLQRG